MKLKNFRAFCGPPDESPGVHADWLDYRLGFETHQTDRKICRLHNSARLVRTYVRACVRACVRARVCVCTTRYGHVYARSGTHVHTSVHASRARAEYVTPRRTPRIYHAKTLPEYPTRSDTPLSFFLSFFLFLFVAPPRPCPRVLFSTTTRRPSSLR